MNPQMPEVAGVTHHYFEVNGFQMHVAEAGQGEPLLLLHGWPQHWYMWHDLIPSLAQHYRVICPDLRGLGWSDAPSGGYDKEQLANDILALMDAMGLDKVRLMAHDWGGWAGFILCVHHPERVQRYLALNIPHLWQKKDWPLIRNSWRFWYQWLIASPILGRWLIHKGGFAKTIIRLNVADKKQWTEERMAVYVDQFDDLKRAAASVQYYRTFVTNEVWTIGRYQANRLQMPTLLLFGVKDFASSTSWLRGYEPYADDMQVELVQDCGHFIVEEMPDLVLRRSLEFFA